MKLQESSYENTAMQRGKQLEAQARKSFEQETGLVVWPNVLIHSEHEFIIASIARNRLRRGKSASSKAIKFFEK